MSKKSIIISTEDFQKYVKDIRKIPVIKNERQIELFTKLKSGSVSKKERQEIYDEIVLGNLRFVISVAKGFQNQGLDLMDLVSEGNIGMINAIEKYNIENGVKFISYAVWWIRQSIFESLNEHARTIRIPTNVILDHQKNKKIKNVWSNEDIFSDHEGLLDIDFNPKQIPYCIDLNSPIDDDENCLIDIIPNINSENPEDILNTSDEIKKKVNLMLSVLNDREKTIIINYFGLNGVEVGLDVIGESLGCTKERVRQIKVTALKKLRNESYDLLKYL